MLNDRIVYMYKNYCQFMDDYRNHRDIDLDLLKSDLITLDNLYGKGYKTPLSDEEYDNLHSIYTSLTNKTIYGDISAKVSKIEHEYPDLKGTILKVHYITKKDKMNDPDAIEAHKCLDDWIYKSYEKLDKNKDHYLEIFPKYDGVSIILSLDTTGKVISAITRGDVDEGVGQDKTPLFYNINFSDMIPEKYHGIPVGLKVEFIMTRAKFEKYNEKLFNNELTDERAGAVSLLNTENISPILLKYGFSIPLLYQPKGEFIKVYHKRDLKMFAIEPYGRKTFKFEANKGYSFKENELRDSIEYMKSIIKHMEVNCDGLVFRWTDDDAVNTLGRNYERNTNNFEIAYKFPKESNYTYLTDIIQDIGTMGQVSYTAEFKPFQYKGRTIKRASLGSYDKMKELKLAKGDMVNIKYDIIPYLVVDAKCKANKSGNPIIEPITNCPYCHNPLVFDDTANPYCNNSDCPSRIMGKIYNYCTRLKMAYIGESIIEDLYHVGILKSIKDLYTLEKHKDQIISLDNIGKKTYKRLLKSINDARNVKEYELIGSIGIPNIGLKKAKKVLSIVPLKKLLKVTNKFDLVGISGIGDKLAKSIIDGINSNRELIDFLLKELNVSSDKNDKDNIVICFTGFRNPKFATYLENEYNITVSESLSKDCSFLVAKNPSAISTKINKAKELNIPIISVDDAYLKFQYKF